MTGKLAKAHLVRVTLATLLWPMAGQAATGLERLPGNSVLSLRSPQTASHEQSVPFALSDLESIRREAIRLEKFTSTAAVLDQIGDAQIVLLGEATHGTSEFYKWRAELTRQLILQKGFDAIALEADADAAAGLDAAIRSDAPPHHHGARTGEPICDALRRFDTFPEWMWSNQEFAALLHWLHRHNAERGQAIEQVSVHGLDLYRPERSAEAVVALLATIDPSLADAARKRYACVQRFADRWEEYGMSLTFGGEASCAPGIQEQEEALDEQKIIRSGLADRIQYHARVVRNAEAYYRASSTGGVRSWNLRDTHMADALDALLNETGRRKKRPAKIVVWAHNSHIGDARATGASERGEHNLGQLVRERHGQARTFLLGFMTYHGSVLAAPSWGEAPERETLRPAIAESVASLFHQTGIPAFYLGLRHSRTALPRLDERRPERAVGVVYRPDSERQSHYDWAVLSKQFDAILHIDHTRALEPLNGSPNACSASGLN